MALHFSTRFNASILEFSVFSLPCKHRKEHSLKILLLCPLRPRIKFDEPSPELLEVTALQFMHLEKKTTVSRIHFLHPSLFFYFFGGK